MSAVRTVLSVVATIGGLVIIVGAAVRGEWGLVAFSVVAGVVWAFVEIAIDRANRSDDYA